VWEITAILKLPTDTTGNIRKQYEALLQQCVKTAWNEISPKSSVWRFEKCCVSNNMNGTENNALLDDNIGENTFLVMKGLAVTS
jgi:hypothetical protein